MLLIDQKTFKYLLNNGCVVGENIHLTHSNKHKYYATECRKVLALLEKYNDGQNIQRL